MVEPGCSVGILGGGQLGRMLAMAAARLGLRPHIYAPAGDNPAFQVCDKATEGAYDDVEALKRFAQSCDVVTLEFENVPADALTAIAAEAPVYPDANALRVSQDRLTEKTFLQEAVIATTRFAKIDEIAELRDALEEFGGQGVLKTRSLGYDGKGQVRLRFGDQAESALAQIGHAPAILEAISPFERELSVIVARGRAGEIRSFDPAENVHRDGILHTSAVPGAIPAEQARVAIETATRLADALGYVGVMGVEFFALPDGKLQVNEFAPRVHNSGHWTIEACAVSQFEQHIRAVCGWPLGDPKRHSDAQMTNLIGDEIHAEALREGAPHTGFHHYGKAEARPGRKMGHVTRLTGPAAR
ncbi:MAG: 5-(carboxyamino)imidazole ribonucleotide synthase [Pseudomonadota bacterium]